MKTETVKIVCTNAFRKLLELDSSLIGTPDYMGLAYFWHYTYRHYLRDASPINRHKVHSAFI